MQPVRRQSQSGVSSRSGSLILVISPNGGYSGGTTIGKAEYSQSLTKILKVSVERRSCLVNEPITLGAIKAPTDQSTGTAAI